MEDLSEITYLSQFPYESIISGRKRKRSKYGDYYSNIANAATLRPRTPPLVQDQILIEEAAGAIGPDLEADNAEIFRENIKKRAMNEYARMNCMKVEDRNQLDLRLASGLLEEGEEGFQARENFYQNAPYLRGGDSLNKYMKQPLNPLIMAASEKEVVRVVPPPATTVPDHQTAPFYGSSKRLRTSGEFSNTKYPYVRSMTKPKTLSNRIRDANVPEEVAMPQSLSLLCPPPPSPTTPRPCMSPVCSTDKESVIDHSKKSKTAAKLPPESQWPPALRQLKRNPFLLEQIVISRNKSTEQNEDSQDGDKEEEEDDDAIDNLLMKRTTQKRRRICSSSSSEHHGSPIHGSLGDICSDDESEKDGAGPSGVCKRRSSVLESFRDILEENEQARFADMGYLTKNAVTDAEAAQDDAMNRKVQSKRKKIPKSVNAFLDNEAKESSDDADAAEENMDDNVSVFEDNNIIIDNMDLELDHEGHDHEGQDHEGQDQREENRFEVGPDPNDYDPTDDAFEPHFDQPFSEHVQRAFKPASPSGLSDFESDYDYIEEDYAVDLFDQRTDPRTIDQADQESLVQDPVQYFDFDSAFTDSVQDGTTSTFHLKNVPKQPSTGRRGISICQFWTEKQKVLKNIAEKENILSSLQTLLAHEESARERRQKEINERHERSLNPSNIYLVRETIEVDHKTGQEKKIYISEEKNGNVLGISDNHPLFSTTPEPPQVLQQSEKEIQLCNDIMLHQEELQKLKTLREEIDIDEPVFYNQCRVQVAAKQNPKRKSISSNCDHDHDYCVNLSTDANDQEMWNDYISVVQNTSRIQQGDESSRHENSLEMPATSGSFPQVVVPEPTETEAPNEPMETSEMSEPSEPLESSETETVPVRHPNAPCDHGFVQPGSCLDENKSYVKGRALRDFCKFVHHRRFANYTFIAHHGSGYDFHWFLRSFLEHAIPVRIIPKGNKIIGLLLPTYGITFKDFFLHVSMSLSRVKQSLNLKSPSKGYFPYKMIKVRPRR